MRPNLTIEEFLKGRTFENAKEAQYVYEKETGDTSISRVWFSRLYAKCPESRITKKEKLLEFFKSAKSASMREMYKEYTKDGKEVSIKYFEKFFIRRGELSHK